MRHDRRHTTSETPYLRPKISDLAMTTDVLLEPDRDVNDVRLVLSVKVKPVTVNFGNIDFGF